MKTKRLRRKNNSMLLIYILLITVIFMVAGYALLSTDITVTGTATADADFGIVWVQTPTITDSSCAAGTGAPSLSSGDTVLTINPVLDMPSCYVEVTGTIENTGAIDAIITGVVPTEPIGTDIVVEYAPTFAESQTLAASGTQQVVITITYDADSTNQAAIEEDFGVVVTYTQDS